MTHALVTGGAGFIGGHLVRALLSRGANVTVLDDLSIGRRENVPSAARFVQGDVRDKRAVVEAMKDADVVIHLAAVVSIRASVDAFAKDADVNLLGTLNVLEAMAQSSVKKAVFASSMAVYGEPGADGVMRETDAPSPLSPYGIAKLAAEAYWLMLGPRLGVRTSALRLFNTYGPGQTPTPYVGVITHFIDRLLSGKPPEVFGDGEQRRDFIHVSDVVSAFLAAIDGDADGLALNVGTGRATSVNDIATRLCALIAPELTPTHALARSEELRQAVADTERIGKRLGWRATRTSLALDEVVAYWRAERATNGQT